VPASQVAPPQQPPPQYAPPGAPYAPHAMPPGPGYPMPPPGARSSKGLVIGLGVGAVAVAGIIVAVVLATRGGGSDSGASSREDLVTRALAAMGEGDVEQLVKLSDPVGLYNLALDCSERDKAAKKDDDKDKDPDKDAAEDEAKDQDAGADDVDDDPQIQEKRIRRQHEKLVEKTKGMKIELISLAGDKDDKAADKAKDGDDAEGTRRQRRGTKKGDEAMKGCVLKVDVELHELIAKVRVTEAEGKQPSEQEARLMAVHAGDSWFLMMAPKLAAGGGAIGAKLRGYRDQMCACKDAACAEGVHEEMQAWAKTVRDDAEKLPRDEIKALDEIDGEMKACRRKLGEGDEGLQIKEALVQLEALKTKMCACADRACADRVQNEVEAWSKSVSAKAQVRGEDVDKVTEITKGLTDCMTRVMKADPNALEQLPTKDSADSGSGGGGPGLASLPACAEYRRQLDRLRACPKYPPTAADAARRGYEQMEKGWAGMRPTPATRDSMNQACESIASSLKDALATMCP
jgi:hypothetical protein